MSEVSNVKEALDLGMQRLGSRTSPEMRARLLTEINVAIKRRERSAVLPWFLDGMWASSTTADIDSTSLPADFLRPIEDGKMRMVTATGGEKKLLRVLLERLRDEFPSDADHAFPEGYAIHGSKVYWGAIPDAVYSFTYPYHKKSGAATDDVADENAWIVNFPDLIILQSCLKIANYHTHNRMVAKDIKEDLSEALNDFWRDTEARLHTDMDYRIED